MKQASRRDIPFYILCYLLLSIVIVLTVAIIFIWRVALLEVITTVNGRSYANRSLYMVGMVFIGMAMFAVVIAAEPYLRFGVTRRNLLRRFWRILVPLVAFAGVGAVIQSVLTP